MSRTAATTVTTMRKGERGKEEVDCGTRQRRETRLFIYTTDRDHDACLV
jgi:hypothetical protein